MSHYRYRPAWIQFLVFILIMVSCNAPHCSWEGDTDFRGLSRHRSTCKYYQKANTLAVERRRARARCSSSSVSHRSHALPHNPHSLINLPSDSSQLGQIQATKDHQLKPIAPCKARVSGAPSSRNDRANTLRVNSPTLPFHDSDVFDVAMANTDEGDVPGVYLLDVCTLY
jgi:hypothetical protein